MLRWRTQRLDIVVDDDHVVVGTKGGCALLYMPLLAGSQFEAIGETRFGLFVDHVITTLNIKCTSSLSPIDPTS